MFAAVGEAGLTEPARAFVRAVGALLEQDPTALPGPQALYETAVLLAEREKLQAVTLSRIADVDRRQLFTLEGAASASGWVAG